MTAKVISFINMKGGVGKTTLTINIGERLADLGQKVLIVDMDPQFNATQSLLFYKVQLKKSYEESDKVHLKENYEETDEELVDQEIKSCDYYDKLSKEQKTILQIFEDASLYERKKNPSLIKEIKENLHLIPGDLKLSKKVSGDESGKVGALMKHLKQHSCLEEFNYILIDCPPTWSILTHSSLVASDYYIIPSKVDLYSSIGINLLEEQIEQKILSDTMYEMTGKRLKSLGIVFTLVHKNIKAEEERKKVIKDNFKDINFFQTDFPHMPSVPTKFIMIGQAQNNSNYSELVNSIEKITNEIVNEINKENNI